MTDDAVHGDAEELPDASSLPKHLAALVGVFEGPPDLGLNHDKYLAYPHGGESGGVASA